MLDHNNPQTVAMHKRRFILLATTIFTLVCIGHLLRIIYRWPLIIASWHVPFYINWLAIVVTGLMAFMGFVYLQKTK